MVAIRDRSVLLLGLLLFLHSVLLRSAASQPRGFLKATVPAFLWSDKGYLDDAHRVNYQATPSEDVINGLIKGLQSSTSSKPSLIVAVIGKQMRSADLGADSSSEVLFSPIQAAISSANSSLVLPYTIFRKKSHHLGVALQQHLNRAQRAGAAIGEVALVGGCMPHYEGFQQLEGVSRIEAYLQRRSLTRKGGMTDVLLVCSPPSMLNAEEDQAEALAAEVAVLDKVYSSILRTTSNYVALYTVDPLDASTRSYQRERILLAAATPSVPDNATCNELCQTKANLLQTVGVSLLLIIILISGLCCAFSVEGPTRFESAND